MGITQRSKPQDTAWFTRRSSALRLCKHVWLMMRYELRFNDLNEIQALKVWLMMVNALARSVARLLLKETICAMDEGFVFRFEWFLKT